VQIFELETLNWSVLLPNKSSFVHAGGRFDTPQWLIYKKRREVVSMPAWVLVVLIAIGGLVAVKLVFTASIVSGVPRHPGRHVPSRPQRFG